MDFWRNEQIRDALHYVAILIALAIYWPPAMAYFQNNPTPTLIGAYFVLVIADKLAHKYFKVQ